VHPLAAPLTSGPPVALTERVFDIIPSDLTVFAHYRRAHEDGAGQLTDTNLVVRSFARTCAGGEVVKSRPN
jgi:short subunit dehydrogenase-like uncharacterized protein